MPKTDLQRNRKSCNDGWYAQTSIEASPETPASRHPKARARPSYLFLEVLPRRNRLILPLEFSEIESPPFAGNRSKWKFIVNAHHSGGVLLSVTSQGEVRAAVPIIQQAQQSVREERQ